jgi:hypothetical protein
VAAGALQGRGEAVADDDRAQSALGSIGQIRRKLEFDPAYPLFFIT